MPEYVYELTHEYTIDNEYDFITYNAVYSTQEKALKGLEKFKNDLHFIEHPDGFCISKCRLDDGLDWSEGFTTMDDEQI